MILFIMGQNVSNQGFRYLEKMLYNIYCMHLKKLIVKINSFMKADSVRDLFKSLLNKEIKCNENQLLVFHENYILDE